MNIILYGPPGVGKTTVGQVLAEALGHEFVDNDDEIVAATGRSIPEIFAEDGEAVFRMLERESIVRLAGRSKQVIALGGGALQDPENRAQLQATGTIICLLASMETLTKRLALGSTRPLLGGEDRQRKLALLLQERRELYDSFFDPIVTDGMDVDDVLDVIIRRVIPTTRRLGNSQILIGAGSRHQLRELLGASPCLMVSDDVIGPLWAEGIARRLDIPLVTISAGEAHKTLATVRTLYDAFMQHGLDRSGAVIAVGGGVVGDITGFAAATYMRGVRWINLPTTLLAMVDASMGGKTGVDLPQGKNLIGAFHPPAMVVADPAMLETLPPAELISGMAEVLKHGVIADPGLFIEADPNHLTRGMIEQAMQVKIDIVSRDPYEHGERAKLNLGHTIGHGVESASQFALRHGESVAIGMVGEAMLAERLGMAEAGLAEQIAIRLEEVGLPIRCQGLPVDLIRQHMQSDKKKHSGQLRFVLPRRVGAVDYGVFVPEEMLMKTLQILTE